MNCSSSHRRSAIVGHRSLTSPDTFRWRWPATLVPGVLMIGMSAPVNTASEVARPRSRSTSISPGHDMNAWLPASPPEPTRLHVLGRSLPLCRNDPRRWRAPAHRRLGRGSLRAVDARVDAIIAHGREACGHVRCEIGTPALVPVLNAATPVPVPAAGGIADACRCSDRVLAIGWHCARRGEPRGALRA